VLAARCLGALQAITGPAPDGPGPGLPAPGTALDPGLRQALSQPAYATFVSEGRDGGIDLITALYPR
jgi:hypothetical protein